MQIRLATEDDFPQMWPFMQTIIEAGESYPYPRDSKMEDIRKLWLEVPEKTFLAEDKHSILGTYYLKPNQSGQGSHVCNCGYMVAPAAAGRGIATQLCQHSQDMARSLGYKAMQFNLVVSTNTVAVNLWSKLGFATVGRLPGAFAHPQHGYVDALVMHKWLAD